MTETELKLQVPATARSALIRAMRRAVVERTRLRAVYVDTADRRLAGAGIALRMRQEGRRWVQTVKAQGDALLERLEHEVVVSAPAPGGIAPALRGAALAPAIDPQRHAGTPVGLRLAAALAVPPGEPAPELVAIYRTDVVRLHRRLRDAAGTVELALDIGCLEAGGQREPLCELEIELLRGRPWALTAVAARWAARHGLWLDARSKAERGERLARGWPALPPARAAAVPAFAPVADASSALRRLVAVCLVPVLGNAGEITGGRGTPEHLHQLRVGLRRLRALLRLYRGWVADIDPGWEPALAEVFRALGARRDRDALALVLLPARQAAGAPLIAWPEGDAPDADEGSPATVLRGPSVTRLMLSLLGFSLGAPGTPAPAPASGIRPAAPTAPTAAPAPEPARRSDRELPERIRRRLARWHRQAMRDARRFEALDEPARHRLRKRIKRLRYAAELSAPWLPRKPLARYLAALAPAQSALGELTDLLAARDAFRRAGSDEPGAWFALGWLSARAEEQARRCAAPLRAMRRQPPPW
ncbi:MAG: CYTH and CHAD domain-containing protein [Betaproteobacteria bacterium]|nr:CYTH and CHAD domain-containing protein [Betaproteobacteria bacterium]